MSSLDRIVKVVITRDTRGIASANFDTLLHISDYAVARIRTYTDLEGLEADYPVDSETYMAGMAYFTQDLHPRQLKIGGVAVSEIHETVNGALTHGEVKASVNVGGVITEVITPFATDKDTTLTNFANDIASAIPEISAGTWGTDTIYLTVVPGSFLRVDFDFSATDVGSHFSYITPSAETPLEAILEVQDLDDQWYGITIESDAVSIDDLVEVAQWAGAEKKFCFYGSRDEDIINVSYTMDTVSLPQQLNAIGANKAMVLYDPNFRKASVDYSTTNFVDVAFASMVLARAVGSYTTVLQQLKGIEATTFTATQRQNALDKNCTVFNELYGVSITEGGRVTDGNVPANGEWIDVEVGLDLVEVRMQERVYLTMVNSEKVPYTNAGAGIIESAVGAVLQDQTEADFFAKFSVTAEDTNDQPQQDRANRVYNGIVWDAQLSGAIHSTTIHGTVRV